MYENGGLRLLDSSGNGNNAVLGTVSFKFRDMKYCYRNEFSDTECECATIDKCRLCSYKTMEFMYIMVVECEWSAVHGHKSICDCKHVQFYHIEAMDNEFLVEGHR